MGGETAGTVRCGSWHRHLSRDGRSVLAVVDIRQTETAVGLVCYFVKLVHVCPVLALWKAIRNFLELAREVEVKQLVQRGIACSVFLD